MPRAVLGLGGNLGARRALLACARALLEGQPGLSVLKASPLYRTPPLGPPQPEYLNAALLVDWVGTARGLLALAQHVEALLLRARGQRWGPRTLDVDVLYWSEGAIAAHDLEVPHPELTRRLFALVPLLDVAPELPAPLGVTLRASDRAFAPSEPFPVPPTPDREGQVTTRCESDPLELISGCLEALSCFAPAPHGPLTTLPFAVAFPGPGAEALVSALQSMKQRAEQARTAGFGVRSGAVTGVGKGGCFGVFVGVRSDALAAPGPLEMRLVPSSDGSALQVTSRWRSALWP